MPIDGLLARLLIYIYSEAPFWLAVSEKYFSTYIYPMGYKGIFLGFVVNSRQTYKVLET
jgi:hypothetical protein